MKESFRTKFRKIFDDSTVMKDGLIKRISPGDVESDDKGVASSKASLKSLKKSVKR